MSKYEYDLFENEKSSFKEEINIFKVSKFEV